MNCQPKAKSEFLAESGKIYSPWKRAFLNEADGSFGDLWENLHKLSGKFRRVSATKHEIP